MRPHIRTRKSRSFKPALIDMSLEPRQLMSGLSPAIAIQSGPSYVGQHFTMQVLNENGQPFAPGVISSVIWNVPGAVTSRTLDVNGFHDSPVSGVRTYGDTLSGYWADSPGAHGITATVNYSGSYMGFPIPSLTSDTIVSAVNVNPITATAAFYVLGNTKVYADPESDSGWSMGAGVGMSVVVNGGALAPLVGGQFGVIQTVKSTVIDRVTGGYDVGGVNPVTLQPYTMLDNSPDVPGGDRNPYYATHESFTGQPATFTVGTDKVLKLGDTPSSLLDDYVDAHGRYDSFNDYVIVTPKGGIPIVAGSFSWEWGGSTMWGPNAYPTLIQAKNPTQTAGGEFGSLVPFSQLPTWDFPVDQEPIEWFKPDGVNTAPFLALLPAGWVDQMNFYTDIFEPQQLATKPINDASYA